MLVGSGLLCVAEVFFWQGTHAILVLVITASTASVIRLSPRLPLLRVFQNKYVLWIGMSLLVRQLRARKVGVELYCVAVVSELSMIALGFYNSKKKLS
jgi:predicted tellurium resistance membrane protein TerC